MGISKSSFFTRNTKRFITAILSILICGLKLVVNILGMSISYLSGKKWKLVGIKANNPSLEALHNMSIPHDSESEEAIKRSHYVVEHSSCDSPIKW